MLEVEEALDSAPGADILIEVRKGKKRSRIIVEVKSHAQLRDARLAIEQLKHYRRQQPGSYAVFCSQYVTPSIKELCQESGLGFFDFAGNCRLVFDDLFIERETPTGPLEKKQLRSLFAPMAARALRRLFNEPHRVWKVMTLAEEASVSPATVSLLKDKLIGDEYVREQDDGFVLQRPARLLQAWASQYRFKHTKFVYYSREPQEELERRFSDYCWENNFDYAFTLFSGARRIAPFTRGVTQSHAYLGDGLTALKFAEVAQLKPVDSGNFTLILPDDLDLLFGRQQVDGVTVVSDIQLYLDLTSHPTRGEENAEYLLEQRLQPKW